MKKTISFLLILFSLLLFHTQAITGAQNGLLLWYQILIPSLLPFILVTNALSETNSYRLLADKLHPLLKNRTYEIIAVLLGNLCGYPIGGKIIHDFTQYGYLTKKRGDTLLAFSSQASPMFIIGYIHDHILRSICPLPVFLCSIYLPTILAYFLHKENLYTTPAVNSDMSAGYKTSLPDTFLQAVKTMVLIGIYVMIFSILYEILEPVCRTNLLRVPLSFLEITTGLNLLKQSVSRHFLYLPLVGALTTFGGLCSIFQISCVFTGAKMNIKKYLRSKLSLSAGTFFILFLYQLFCQTIYP